MGEEPAQQVPAPQQAPAQQTAPAADVDALLEKYR